jgi:hypothetical protein
VLPAIGAGLGFVFQIDDAFGGDGDAPRRRVADAPAAPVDHAEDDENQSSERRARGEH